MVEKSYRIKCAAIVESLTHANQPFRTVGHLLPSNAQGQPSVLARLHRHVCEQLVNVNAVAVGGPWPTWPTVFERALQLAKRAQPLGGMVIGVEKVTLQNVGVVGIRVGVEAFVFVSLEAFTRLAAERQKPSATSGKRDVFDRIPEITPLSRIRKKAVILIVAQRFQGLPRPFSTCPVTYQTERNAEGEREQVSQRLRARPHKHVTHRLFGSAGNLFSRSSFCSGISDWTRDVFAKRRSLVWIEPTVERDAPRTARPPKSNGMSAARV